jgi:hypothetical protein
MWSCSLKASENSSAIDNLRHKQEKSPFPEGKEPVGRMLCSEAILINQGVAEGHATILRCKRWCCELCTPFNHRRVKRAARDGKPNTFLTLTVSPKRYSSPDAAARDLKNAWLNLRRRMQKSFAMERPPFIAIFERTKQGWPHLHILMRCRFISQRWYSANMGELIGAPIVDVRFIQDASRVAAYVAKYVSKAPEAFNHCKRWWRSKDYELEKQECEPFRRFSPHVHEFAGTISQWLWKSTGGSAQLVSAREDYWHWRIHAQEVRKRNAACGGRPPHV